MEIGFLKLLLQRLCAICDDSYCLPFPSLLNSILFIPSYFCEFFLFVDINECAEGSPCQRNEQCINTHGSYRCRPLLTCGVGYQMNDMGSQCIGKSSLLCHIGIRMYVNGWSMIPCLWLYRFKICAKCVCTFSFYRHRWMCRWDPSVCRQPGVF